MSGSPKARADELVLRAVRQVLQGSEPAGEARLKGALCATLTRLAQFRPAPVISSEAAGMERALLDLPASHRAALILVAIENCTYDEAAKVLGVSRNVLVGRLTAARLMMSRQMQEEASHLSSRPYLRLVK